MQIGGYKITRREENLLYFCLLFLLVTIFIRGVSPLRARLRETREELAMVAQVEERQQRALAAVSTLQKEGLGLLRELKVLADRFYYGTDSTQTGLLFLAEVTRQAEAAGLSIESRSLLAPVSARDGTKQLGVELSFQARPEAVARFLATLAAAPHAIAPHALSLQARESGKVEGRVLLRAALLPAGMEEVQNALARALVRSGAAVATASGTKGEAWSQGSFSPALLVRFGRLFFAPAAKSSTPSPLPQTQPAPALATLPPVEPEAKPEPAANPTRVLEPSPPPPSPSAHENGESLPPASQFTLKGIVHQEGRAHAVLAEPRSGVTYLVGVGEVVKGEEVLEITPQSVTLGRGRAQWTLTMPR